MSMQKYNDNIEIFQKKIGIHINAKIQIDEKVRNAVLVQDKIRSKIQGWDGTKEIRKWRDRKAS